LLKAIPSYVSSHLGGGNAVTPAVSDSTPPAPLQGGQQSRYVDTADMLAHATIPGYVLRRERYWVNSPDSAPKPTPASGL
jgi:hypothetical protein